MFDTSRAETKLAALLETRCCKWGVTRDIVL